MVTLTIDTSGLVDGTQIDKDDPLTPVNGLKTHQENTLNGVQAFDQITFGPPESVAISLGVLTVTKTHVLVSGEAGASADDLDTISAGGQGKYLKIRAASGVSITIKHGTGNIRTQSGSDFGLAGDAWALALYTGTKWLVMSPAATIALQERSGSTVLSASTLKVPDRSALNEGGGVQRLMYVPSFEAGNSFWVRAAAATVEEVGVALPTIANTPANANDSDGAFVTLPTTAVSGNAGGIISTTFNLLRREWNPVLVVVVKTPVTPDPITSLRYWIGLCAAAPADNDNVGTSFIGWRFSTVAADTGWRPITRDTTTQNTATAIGTVGAATLFKLALRVDSANGKVFFSVNDSAETEVTANLPATTTDLGFVVRTFTQTAAIRSISFNRLYTEFK